MSNLIDKETKAKWVEDLRSGQYQQLNGALFDGDNSYCCLGVLQRIRRKDVPVAIKHEYPDGEVWWEDPFEEFPYYEEEFQNLVPIWDELSNINDNGYSFSEIADVIEKNVETSD